MTETKRKPESPDAIKARQDAYKARQKQKGIVRVTPAFQVPKDHKAEYLKAINDAGKRAIKRLDKQLDITG